jgi:hypothetical protein
MLLLFLLLSACSRPHSLEDDLTDAFGCPKPADMATPAPKCAAARGLGGDNLLCVDFKDVQMPSSLAGWDFTCTGGTFWTATSRLLEVNNFGSFNKDCTATLPAINLNDADKQKYKSLMLSVMHRIDLNETAQTAEIYLNSSTTPRRMWQLTGRKDVARQRTVVEVDKADLPALVNNGPQWVLKIASSAAGGGFTGWQIESIAINGLP